MLALTPLSLLLLALATWRLSAMISYEVGPWRLFVRLRSIAGIIPDPEDGSPAGWNADSFLAVLFGCLWCVSVWIGAGLLLLVAVWPPALWIVGPLALSAGAILIERLARGR